MDDIGIMTEAERARVSDWAAAEGWNPGASDMACFARVDPQGFFAGRRKGEMVASISVVNYGTDFAFLGFYIVQPELRGQGHGLRLWQAAMEHAGDRVVGLDGVVAQQANYQRSGFDLAYRNIRFGGVIGPMAPEPGLELRPVTAPFAALERMDAEVFPATRSAFWEAWLTAPGHRSVAAFDGAALAGFGTLRACQSGYKVGPLVARDLGAARAVLGELTRDLPAGAEVFLDVPEPNVEAVVMAKGLGLRPVFETARMYRGPAPHVDLSRVFGVTTFELG
ncbi:GNAT family N-acetyltransferase [Pseudodonghicola flavimaris]|uniref:GNAT family N-acetyltransferase n=1 Tax=Pseudodonghicola flavimaris TaxID=3050036 RepID=A0ABT7EV44_9RHOB|nr:GNAT family N-acetyltransferase [Pseudodonghicola flavimaris]MDK3016221.1 GNAT family N-acetyltransferase [Pseudodonghicola flavimaris]